MHLICCPSVLYRYPTTSGRKEKKSVNSDWNIWLHIVIAFHNSYLDNNILWVYIFQNLIQVYIRKPTD